MGRDGTKNLKPVRSKEEAKERGKKGGVASGVARRRKRAMKEAAKVLLDMPVQSEGVKKAMTGMGFEEQDLTNQMAMLVAIWKSAMEGNVPAAIFMRDTAGQKVEQNQNAEEFEYRKERDSGITQEIEDMDEIEGEIYGSS